MQMSKSTKLLSGGQMNSIERLVRRLIYHDANGGCHVTSNCPLHLLSLSFLWKLQLSYLAIIFALEEKEEFVKINYNTSKNNDVTYY